MRGRIVRALAQPFSQQLDLAVQIAGPVGLLEKARAAATGATMVTRCGWTHAALLLLFGNHSAGQRAERPADDRALGRIAALMSGDGLNELGYS
jgi:hypothetical protein